MLVLFGENMSKHSIEKEKGKKTTQNAPHCLLGSPHLFFLSHSPIKVGFMAADPLFEEVSLRQHNPDGVKSTVLFRLRS